MPAWDYLAGLVQAGFLGVRQIKFSPWRVIDGIHFCSLTLTGYKLPGTVESNGVQFATLLGPFSRAVDELGQTYHRGKPEPVTARTAQLLKTPPFDRVFLLSEAPVSLATTDERLVAILPAAYISSRAENTRPGWLSNCCRYASPRKSGSGLGRPSNTMSQVSRWRLTK